MRRGVVVAAGLAVTGGVIVAATGVFSQTDTEAVLSGPIGPVEMDWQVSRIVDGDTIVVTRNGQRVKVRLIGIDTPESVRPDSPVECFGPEASAFAEQVLQGRTVQLESDPSQGSEDAYGRQLAYVWYLDDAGNSVLFNQQAIAAGVAREYTYSTPYVWRDAFVAAQQRARSGDQGLWAACR